MIEVSAIDIPSSSRSIQVIERIEMPLIEQLADKNLMLGSPVFIRIFKDPGVLEVWVKSENNRYIQFKRYDICNFSGDLGPKLKEGDKQSPEGFYYVNADRLNPWSRFHLSFDLGYPNKYDRIHGRTGSALMVHGGCRSIGCYAMTDEYINEIYVLVDAALRSGQPFFRVHVFPFELESEKLSRFSTHQWYSFWVNLKEGYDYFNDHGIPPNVEVMGGKYIFGE